MLCTSFVSKFAVCKSLLCVNGFRVKALWVYQLPVCKACCVQILVWVKLLSVNASHVQILSLFKCSVFQASVCKSFSAHWFLRARSLPGSKSFATCRRAQWLVRQDKQCSGSAAEKYLDEMWQEMRWDEKSWDEARRDQVTWDEIKCGVWRWSVNAKYEVWRMQFEVWNFTCHLWSSAPLSHEAHTHGPGWRTARANSIDERSFTVYP